MPDDFEAVRTQDIIALTLAPFESLNFVLSNVSPKLTDPEIVPHIEMLLHTCTEQAERCLRKHLLESEV